VDEDQAAPESVASKLIVIYSNSKKPIHFCKDCKLFCEGVNAATAKPSGLFNHNLAFGLILAFGFILVFGLNLAFGRNLAFSLNLAFGLITAIGHNLAFGFTMAFDLIMAFGLFSFGLSELAAL
jgi:hypothetical protein